jgi:catechol 2,3-dioxygenase
MDETTSRAETQAPPRTVATPVLHHVNLKTNRLGELIEWYGTVCGMTVTYQYPGGAWLSNDAANHRLALLCVPGLSDDPDKVAHTGMHHTAFEFRSLEELLDTYERLRQEGILPHGCLDHGMTISFYYADPDGNSVEMQSDCFGDWAQSTAFMHNSPEFAADPIGVQIDPDRLLSARAEGANAEVIHRRARAGEFTPEQPLDLRLP